MNSNNVAGIFTKILKTAVVRDWDHHEISKLVCCLHESLNHNRRVNPHDFLAILQNTGAFSAPVLVGLLEEEMIPSHITFSWILKLEYNAMMEVLRNCFDEDTYTVLSKYEEDIMVYLCIMHVYYI